MSAKQEHPKTSFAKRWIPWLCAYTGTRVGEIAQLRKEDIGEEEGITIIRITSEVGDVKTKEYREIPIHTYLVEEGFLKFVEQQPDGYLFLNVAAGDSIRPKRTTLKNRLGEFMRSVVSDPEVQSLLDCGTRSKPMDWKPRSKAVCWIECKAARILRLESSMVMAEH